MGLSKVFRIFRPKDRVFFQHFEGSAKNVLRMSEDLIQLMATSPGAQRTAILERLIIAENANDDLTHTIFKDLARNFITPIDREDIHALAVALDDVADFIIASGKGLDLYDLWETDDTMKELARLVNEGAVVLHQAMLGLKDMHKLPDPTELLVRVNSIENEADAVYDRGLQRIFRNETDPIHLMKLRLVYQDLELATDKCEDVANVLESVMLKYA